MKVTVKIERNESDEYECVYYEDGIRNEPKTYYTNDKDDADQTRLAMLIEAEKAGHDVVMKTKKHKVLTVWTPKHCPADTGGDYKKIFAAAVSAVCLAVEHQVVATVLVDTVVTDETDTEIRRDGVTFLSINGKKLNKDGSVRQ